MLKNTDILPSSFSYLKEQDVSYKGGKLHSSFLIQVISYQIWTGQAIAQIFI